MNHLSLDSRPYEYVIERRLRRNGSEIGFHVNRPKRRNPPCAAPPLSSFPMGKKLDTTQRGASQGGFLLLGLFICVQINVVVIDPTHIIIIFFMVNIFSHCKDGNLFLARNDCNDHLENVYQSNHFQTVMTHHESRLPLQSVTYDM